MTEKKKKQGEGADKSLEELADELNEKANREKEKKEKPKPKK